MRYGDRTDAENLASAQAGWAPAFAVLLHRHGPAVRSAVRDEPDPIAATRDVFVTALQELPHMPADTVVRDWLLDIAGTSRVPDPIVPLCEEERDAIWAELTTAWPTRRRPRRRVLRRIALVAGLVALAGAVPTLLLLAEETPERDTIELFAHPVVEPTVVEDPVAPEPAALPTFSFPTASSTPPRLATPPGPTTPPMAADPVDDPRSADARTDDLRTDEIQTDAGPVEADAVESTPPDAVVADDAPADTDADAESVTDAPLGDRSPGTRGAAERA